MKRRYVGFLGIALLAALAAGQGQPADDTALPFAEDEAAPQAVPDDAAPQLAGDATATQAVRFAWVDIYVDSGDVPLAAYQFELAAETGAFQIVGVEGGEPPAFAEPPYYDPAALAHDRILIAAFSTDDELPAGRTRVARIHVQITGGETPDYVVKLTVAATADGTEIPAAAAAAAGEGR
jgi:hypothetical protein